MAKTIKEMREVMEWFDNGGTVEYVETGFDDWEVASHPTWNWYDYEYRIKESKPKVTIEKWLCSRVQGEFVVIETSNIDGYEYHKKLKLIESYEIEL